MLKIILLIIEFVKELVELLLNDDPPKVTIKKMNDLADQNKEVITQLKLVQEAMDKDTFENAESYFLDNSIIDPRSIN
jgi:hypothetical protein